MVTERSGLSFSVAGGLTCYCGPPATRKISPLYSQMLTEELLLNWEGLYTGGQYRVQRQNLCTVFLIAHLSNPNLLYLLHRFLYHFFQTLVQ